MSKAYDKTAEIILDLLENGVAPWQKPWNSGAPQMGATGHTYRGWNSFYTGYIASVRDYKSTVWATFNQIKKQDCKLVDAKGKGVQVVGWFPVTNDPITKKPLPKGKRFMMPRCYIVFNLDLVEGDFKVPKKAVDGAASDNDNGEILTAEDIAGAYLDAPPITYGGSVAAYSPTSDKIRMPKIETFKSSEEYYCTLFHEMAHSTGHASRLARPGVTDKNSFASHAYGQEELVAEFTASFLCGAAGISELTIGNSAAYIAGWKKTIKADSSIVLKAIGQAQRAADRITGDVAPAFSEDVTAAA